MPIVVKVVTGAEFDAWVAAGGSFDASNIASQASSAPAVAAEAQTAEVQEETASSVIDVLVPSAQAADEPSAKTWTKEDLMTKGEAVSATCAACHGADGSGLPGVFPAIAGSAVAAGPIDDHIKIVMFGKPGTAMAAFGGQLSDEEIAAVVTYQRNSFGNDTGDIVLPADVQAKRN